MPDNASIDHVHLEDPEIRPSRDLLTSLDRMFLVLLAVSCLGNLLAPIAMEMAFPNIRSDRFSVKVFFGSILAGLLVSEFSLISYWAISDRKPIPHRSVVVFVVGLLLGICLVLGLYAWPGMPLGFAIFALCGSSLFGFINWLYLILWDRLFRLTVVAPDANLGQAIGKRQFGIGYLLGLMAIVAVGFVVIKQILPQRSGWLTETFEIVALALWLLWLVVGVSAIALFLRNAILSQNITTRIWAVVLLLLGPLLFQAVASGMFGIAGSQFRFSIGPRILAIAYSMEIGISLGCLLGALLMRRQGYRLANTRTISESSNLHSQDS